jgi:phage tail-like protein
MKQDEIKKLLPGVFERTVRPGNPMTALLDVMEHMHTPSEEILARLDTYFNPYTTPDAFVAYLAGWVDLEMFLSEAPEDFANSAPPTFPSGVGRLRELVASAAYLSKWRGTGKGLLLFLEIATGVQGYTVDEHVKDKDGLDIPYHIRVSAPAITAPYEPMIRRIIQLEKPAYVTYELEFEKPRRTANKRRRTPDDA